MKWTETITPKQAAEELGVPYHGWMREMDRAWISEDGQYSVMSRLLRTPVGKVEHVAITSAAGCGKCDGSGDIPWAVKMQIKNELFGEKRAAIEVYPSQDRLVDAADTYHLWVFEKGLRCPLASIPGMKSLWWLIGVAQGYALLMAKVRNTASRNCWSVTARPICPSAPMLT